MSIDRVHNEFLETLFSYGIIGGLLYLIFFGLIIKIFFTAKEPVITLLSLLILGNIFQNQFTFPDITICVFIAFCVGALIALTAKKKQKIVFVGHPAVKIIMAVIIVVFSGFVFIKTIYDPFMSQWLYFRSHEYYDTSYDNAIMDHKKALDYTPYYSTLWYDLIFIDPSSMGRALDYLEQIEGNSGNVLAWKGNYYSDSDPAKASSYYLEALKKNPYYPNWIRAYADMLYKNGDYKNALYLYKQYLEAAPDFWKWTDVEQRSPEDQKSYRIFFKNVPDFWTTVERVLMLDNSAI